MIPVADIPYPHEGGCHCCTYARVCNVCGEPLGSDRCTNGRCGRCHRSECTTGGQTSPGHGYGKPHQIARDRAKAA